MSTVVEIESAIEKLPPSELGQLLAWLDDYRAMGSLLHGGDGLAVLKDGETCFLASKPGPRPQHSTQELTRLAQSVRGKRRSFDGVALLKNLR